MHKRGHDWDELRSALPADLSDEAATEIANKTVRRYVSLADVVDGGPVPVTRDQDGCDR